MAIITRSEFEAAIHAGVTAGIKAGMASDLAAKLRDIAHTCTVVETNFNDHGVGCPLNQAGLQADAAPLPSGSSAFYQAYDSAIDRALYDHYGSYIEPRYINIIPDTE